MTATDTSPLRIAFMGSPDFAVPSLRALVEAGHEVVCVYAQPPRPAGRGQKERLTPVDEAAIELGIPVRTPRSLRGPQEQAEFAALDLDVAVVAAYGLILPREILEAPRLGCINVHASLLPRWRGAAPIQRAILAGDAETGVTIMQMDVGLDTGDMLLSRSVPITAETTGQNLHDQLSLLGAELLVPAVAGLAQGALTGTPQPEEGVTYAKKLERDEGRLDFRRPAVELERLVRAFDPWPGAFFEHDGTRIKVLAAEAFEIGPISNLPGTVLDPELTISCADGAFRPTRVQRPGKGPMDVPSFLRGFQIPLGTVLTG
ncbi:methionyl-tRNA formyltransferase [Thalassobaculum sp.]|uniref:methionyl-tRNA formyltransferase n=1 Tax=Thalassobaculum sp. TaxID=2022740 RepID=UPI003B5A0281